MSDTSYSVELKGLDLPGDVRNKIETAMRGAVMGELAKLDLNNIKVEPLPSAGGRMIGFPPLMGFIIRNLALISPVDRSNIGQPLGSFSSAFGDGTDALIAGSSTEALETLYLRPDVRAAVIANSRAFAEMLSRDEQAAKAFNALVSDQGTERIAPLLVVLGAAAAGAAIGYFSRK